MEMMTSRERDGLTRGIAQGKEALVVCRRRLGAVPEGAGARLGLLLAEQLDDSGEAQLNFSTAADLEQWLTQRSGG